MTLIRYSLLFLTLTIAETTAQVDQRIITTLKYSTKYRTIPTVVNGHVADISQVPYMVSIKEPTKTLGVLKVWSNLCGGSIINKMTVLTAAHCFETNNFLYYHRPFILRLVAGNLSTDLIDEGQSHNHENTQWRKITRVTLHSDFHFPDHDLALVSIDKEWDYSENVDFVNIAAQNIDYPTMCSVAGFGRVGFTKSDSTPPNLLLGKINLLTKNQCNNLWEINMNGFICTTTALADVSNGDSGGPLTCTQTKDPSERLGRPLLVGVVSGKNFDRTTLFTRVSAYYDWIERNDATTLQIQLPYFIPATFLFAVLFPYLIS